MSSAQERLSIDSPFSSRWALTRSVAVVFFLALIFHGSIEFRYQDLMGYDGYYHIKHAELYRSGECSVFGGDFPWAQFSGYNDLRHDWQLGYHLLLIPFTFFGLILGAKLSVVFFAACLIAVVYLILRLEGARWAMPITLVFMINSSLQIWRLHLPRPTTLFLSVFLLTAYAASKKNYKGTTIGVMMCLLIYNVPHSVLALAGIATAFVSWKENKIAWKLLSSFGLGLILGILLHPGFWHWQGSFFGGEHGTFAMWEVINGTLEAAKNGNQVTVNGSLVPINTPSEFEAMNGRDMLRYLSLPFGLLGMLFILRTIRSTKIDLMAQISLSLAALFFALFLSSARFVEYWIPLFFVGGGLLFSKWFIESLEDRGCAAPQFGKKIGFVCIALATVQAVALSFSTDLTWAYLLLALVGVLVIVALVEKTRQSGFDVRVTSIYGVLILLVGFSGFTGLRDLGLSLEHWPFEFHRGGQYEKAMIWLEEHSVEGELVFHPEWTDFAPMFFFNHKNHYVVSSDPYFFFKHDPELYAAWREVSHTKVRPERLDEVLETMGARYAFSRRTPQWQALIANLKALENCELVYSDRYAVVFERH